MSTTGSTANLTSKFSRSSLKQATGLSSARVHSREEELARATNKRFNSESWRKLTRNYKTFPVVSDSGSIPQGNSNTQILYALSSLTEDQAFQNGSSDIPLLSRSASYMGNTFGTAREKSPFRRPHTPYAAPSQYSTYSDESPNNSGRLTEATTSSSASGSFDDAGDDFHDCEPEPVAVPTSMSKQMPRTKVNEQSAQIHARQVNEPPPQIQARQNSLRNVAGRVPKLTKALGNRTREISLEAHETDS